MTREELLAQLALVDDYRAAHGGQALAVEQVLDWAVARGRIPPFANPLARALAAETMREAVQRERVRIDADGTLSERDVDLSDAAVDRNEVFEGLASEQPAPPRRGKPGRPRKAKGE